ncbi:hypothetical protein T492DRAFT_1120328 [Pavlovales sp. CCMP2436]|nr:hypothetical protein T492DRAFT_1120328 [Pavlovales sp. CCMP2436]
MTEPSLADAGLSLEAKLSLAGAMLDAGLLPNCERTVFDWLAATLQRSIKQGGGQQQQPATGAGAAAVPPSQPGVSSAHAGPATWDLLCRLLESDALERLLPSIGVTARLLLTAAARALDVAVGALAPADVTNGEQALPPSAASAVLASSLLRATSKAVRLLCAVRCSLSFRPPLESLCAFAEKALDASARVRQLAQRLDGIRSDGEGEAGAGDAVAEAVDAAEGATAAIAEAAMAAVEANCAQSATRRQPFAAVVAKLLRPCLALLAAAHCDGQGPWLLLPPFERANAVLLGVGAGRRARREAEGAERAGLHALAVRAADVLRAALCHPEHAHAYAALLLPRGEGGAADGAAEAGAKEEAAAIGPAPKPASSPGGKGLLPAASYERVLPEALAAAAALADSHDLGRADSHGLDSVGSAAAHGGCGGRGGGSGGAGGRGAHGSRQRGRADAGAAAAGAWPSECGGEAVGVHGGLCYLVGWFTEVEACRRGLLAVHKAQRESAAGAAGAAGGKKRRKGAGVDGEAVATLATRGAGGSVAFAMFAFVLRLCEVRLEGALDALDASAQAGAAEAGATAPRGEAARPDRPGAVARAGSDTAADPEARAAAVCASALLAAARALQAARHYAVPSAALAAAGAAGGERLPTTAALALVGGTDVPVAAYEPHADAGKAQLRRLQAHADVATRAVGWWRGAVAADARGGRPRAATALVAAALCAHAHALSLLCPPAVEAPPVLRACSLLLDARAHAAAAGRAEAGPTEAAAAAAGGARALGVELLRSFGARRRLPVLAQELLRAECAAEPGGPAAGGGSGGSGPPPAAAVVAVADAASGALVAAAAAAASRCWPSGLAWLGAALAPELARAPRAQVAAMWDNVAKAVGGEGRAEGGGLCALAAAAASSETAGGGGGALAHGRVALAAAAVARQVVVATALADATALDRTNCHAVGAAAGRLLPRLARAHDRLARAAMRAAAEAAAAGEQGAPADPQAMAALLARADALAAAWAGNAQLWRAAHAALLGCVALGYRADAEQSDAEGAATPVAAGGSLASLRVLLAATRPAPLPRAMWPESGALCTAFGWAAAALPGLAATSGQPKSASAESGRRPPCAGALALSMVQLATRRLAALQVEAAYARGPGLAPGVPSGAPGLAADAPPSARAAKRARTATGTAEGAREGAEAAELCARVLAPAAAAVNCLPATALAAAVPWSGCAIELAATGPAGASGGACAGALEACVALFDVACASSAVWDGLAGAEALHAFARALVRAVVAPPPPPAEAAAAVTVAAAPAALAGPPALGLHPPGPPPGPPPAGTLAPRPARVSARSVALRCLADASLPERPRAQAAVTRALVAQLGALLLHALQPPAPAASAKLAQPPKAPGQQPPVAEAAVRFARSLAAAADAGADGAESSALLAALCAQCAPAAAPAAEQAPLARGRRSALAVAPTDAPDATAADAAALSALARALGGAPALACLARLLATPKQAVGAAEAALLATAGVGCAALSVRALGSGGGDAAAAEAEAAAHAWTDAAAALSRKHPRALCAAFAATCAAPAPAAVKAGGGNLAVGDAAAGAGVGGEGAQWLFALASAPAASASEGRVRAELGYAFGQALLAAQLPDAPWDAPPDARRAQPPNAGCDAAVLAAQAARLGEAACAEAAAAGDSPSAAPGLGMCAGLLRGALDAADAGVGAADQTAAGAAMRDCAAALCRALSTWCARATPAAVPAAALGAGAALCRAEARGWLRLAAADGEGSAAAGGEALARLLPRLLDRAKLQLALPAAGQPAAGGAVEAALARADALRLLLGACEGAARMRPPPSPRACAQLLALALLAAVRAEGADAGEEEPADGAPAADWPVAAALAWACVRALLRGADGARLGACARALLVGCAAPAGGAPVELLAGAGGAAADERARGACLRALGLACAASGGAQLGALGPLKGEVLAALAGACAGVRSAGALLGALGALGALAANGALQLPTEEAAAVAQALAHALERALGSARALPAGETLALLTAAYRAVDALLRVRAAALRRCAPAVLALWRLLLQPVLLPSALPPLAVRACARQLGRLYEVAAREPDTFRRHGAYALSDYVCASARGALAPGSAPLLLSGVHALLGVCEAPQLNHLFGSLDDTGKERFRELHERYARDGKFAGRV